ncbi:MAG: folylpolyglutamate synthase/dihydrofolate synthase family protein [Planctomycetota bacterium]|nr:folylpolyglutamate synthase/dihydrofolate synthase family protein [Planctomycetota bacterium]
MSVIFTANSSAASPVEYQQAIDFLFGRIDYERAAAIPYGRREFRLDRMRQLLAYLDHPHRAMKIVHIAGTKGKGSTAAMIAAVLSASGYCTGLYSSPHLDRIEERLAVDGMPCPADDLVLHLARLRPIIEKMDRAAAAEGLPGTTYFEITTALALLHFVRQGVEIAVVEVGLGGRLDSTNVCQPLISVITSISYDHMAQLGNTLAQIAYEKAGIIKPGVPVISGVLADEPRRVINHIRQQRGCTLAQLGEDFDFEYSPPQDLHLAPAQGKLRFRSRQFEQPHAYDDLPLGLLGRHQAANAAVALATLSQLANFGWKLPEAAIREGIAQVSWPARVEVVMRHPTVVVDAAHNMASVESLLETLDESFSARRRWLVFASSQDKQVRQMLQRLLPRFDGVILTRYQSNPRYTPVEDLLKMAREIDASRPNASPAAENTATRIQICESSSAAWHQVRALAGPEDLICVTGSFFLAAEILAEIRSVM